MRAVIQEKPGDELYVWDIPIPEPGPGEVLVKINYAPINPSDLSLLQGTFASKPDYPLIPGIEGSGIVVKSGKGVIGKLREGKRVACTSSVLRGGTWAEYMVTSAFRVIPLGKHISDEQGSMLLVNPLTAYAFIEIAKKHGAGTIVNNAAASSLGRMLIHLCKMNGLTLINIVKRESQIKSLKEAGAKYILTSESADFEKELEFCSDKLNAKLFFDAVGGEQTEIMLKVSPPGSIVISYAKLSEQNISIDPRTLIQQDKKLEGFYLGSYTAGKSVLQNLKTISSVKKILSGDIKIKVAGTYDLSDINKALNNYRSNMSEGKVLLYPGQNPLNC
ncbi:MAG: zinc-binding dehydrogenase [Bacteroidales bacterium]|nr:zinc-binding dehydrogenase [Bacteroidales bacterium]